MGAQDLAQALTLAGPVLAGPVLAPERSVGQFIQVDGRQVRHQVVDVAEGGSLHGLLQAVMELGGREAASGVMLTQQGSRTVTIGI